MRIWIDCEFNEFKGALISMALVAEDGSEFYEVLDCKNPGSWVAEHVMPVLGKSAVPFDLFLMHLHSYLSQFDTVHLIADWPEDIKHFCDVLIVGRGLRIRTPPLTMEVVRIDAPSEVPHNALHDARGIMRAMTQSGDAL